MKTRHFVSSALVVALLVFSTPSKVKAQSSNEPCSSTYNPSSLRERTSSELFDGRVGRITFTNGSDRSVTVKLYHPDSPNRAFSTQEISPGENIFLGEHSYGSDWGIQVNDSLICIIGRVSDWNLFNGSQIFQTGTERVILASSSSQNISQTASNSSLSQIRFGILNNGVTSGSFNNGVTSGSFNNEVPSSNLNNLATQANSQINSGDYKGAINTYTEIIQLTKDNEDKFSTINSYFRRGNAYYQLAAYQNAIEDYNQVIQLALQSNPDPCCIAFLPEAYYNRGNSRYKLGQLQQAQDDYTKAIQKNAHQFPEAYYNRSTVHSQLGNEEAAIEDLDEISRLYTDPADNVLAKLKQYQAAGVEDQVDKISELDLSNFDEDIMPILISTRWDGYGDPLIPRKGAGFKYAETIHNQATKFVRQKKYDRARQYLMTALKTFIRLEDVENAKIVREELANLPQR